MINKLAALAALTLSLPLVAQAPASLTIQAASPLGTTTAFVEFELDVNATYGIHLTGFDNVPTTQASSIPIVSTKILGLSVGNQSYLDHNTSLGGTTGSSPFIADINCDMPFGTWTGVYLAPGRYAVKVRTNNGSLYNVTGSSAAPSNSDIAIVSGTMRNASGVACALQGNLTYQQTMSNTITSLDRISRVNETGTWFGPVRYSSLATTAPFESPTWNFNFFFQSGINPAGAPATNYAELHLNLSLASSSLSAPAGFTAGPGFGHFVDGNAAGGSVVAMTTGGMFFPWQYNFTIPNDPTLKGTVVHFQVLATTSGGLINTGPVVSAQF